MLNKFLFQKVVKPYLRLYIVGFDEQIEEREKTILQLLAIVQKYTQI